MIRGQRNQWWPGATRREAERAELKRQADAILRSDRRRARSPDAPKPRRQKPEPLRDQNGWIHGLENLRRAMRTKGQS